MHHPPPTNRPRPRVLLTGAAGFIGSALTRELLEWGWEVIGVDDFSAGWPERVIEHPRLSFVRGDVGEPGLLHRLLRRAGPCEALVHLAARVGVAAVLADPEGCRAQNLAGVRELLGAIESSPRAQRPRLYCASSSEVYAPSALPLSEADPLRDRDGVGRWAYAASKRLGEEQLDAASRLWPAERGPVHLRFFNVVGPGQDADSGMVLPTFVERALDGSPIPVHGDGEQVRTFAHVDQVAVVLRELVCTPSIPAGALNVGGVARTPIGELARTVRELAESVSPIEHDDPRRSYGNFEAIAFREPCLRRLESSGLTVPSATLEEIVRDTLARHADRSRPRVLREAGGERWCASPAS